MKKLIVVVFVLLVLALPSGSASADFVCDRACMEEILTGGVSEEELSYYGTGNLVRALTSYYEGDVWMALRMLNLASNSYVAASTMNYIYGTQFEISAVGFFKCPSGYSYCEEGEFLGYFQDDADVYRVTCTTSGVCQEEIILEDEPSRLLEELFFKSCHYGGSGEWGLSCEEVPR